MVIEERMGFAHRVFGSVGQFNHLVVFADVMLFCQWSRLTVERFWGFMFVVNGCHIL